MKLCEDMKTFSNGSIIIRSTFSQKMCFEKARACSWPQCLAKDSLGQQATGFTSILGPQQALLQGGVPASLGDVSARTFGCRNRLKQMFVCCSM